MSQVAVAWHGDDWEARCLLLLRVRYRPPANHHFQRVPADDQGDHGIEGFSTDGCVYQCYAADTRLKIRDRYEAQRDKLTEDIGKLIANEHEIGQLLGDVKIARYYFMVPVHDSKRLNKHAQDQAKRVRDAELAIVAETFDVVIVTEDDFPVEVETIFRERLERMNLTPIDVTSEAIEEFLDAQPAQVETMDSKLSKIPELATTERRAEVRRRLIQEYIRGENVVGQLRDRHPAGYEVLEELRSQEEESLPLRCALSTSSPLQLLEEVREEYARHLESELTFMRDRDISRIGWATTAEWLMECPLDFQATT